MARAYLEHVAFYVRDIHWHVRFFKAVFGNEVRDTDGDPADPKQVWLHGGLQFIAAPEFAGPEGRMAHLGVMCEDVEATIAAARPFGVGHLDKGENWLVLPDGLIVELLPAAAGSVAEALSVKPRG